MAAGIGLALLASLAWGVSDFLGGVAAGGARLAVVLAGSQLAGLIAFAPLLLLHATALPVDNRLLLGVAAGAVAVGELGLIYVALKRGPAVIMAPIAALGAMLPVLVGIAGGDRVDLLIATGLLCALTGTAGACWTSAEDRRPAGEGFRTAMIAGGAALGAGAVLALLDGASHVDAWWAVGALRGGASVTAVCWLLAITGIARLRRASANASAWALFSSARGSTRTATVIIAVGLSDVAADVAYANASRAGALSVVSVLASLYPVTTIGLGVLVLRERPRRVQLAGAALAFAGVAILASATR